MEEWALSNFAEIKGIRRLTYIALLVSIGLVLHLIESFLPPLFPFPGAKLGLANIVTLVALVAFGSQAGGQVVGLRIFLASLMAGSFLTLPFYLSLVGGTLAFLIMALLARYAKRYFSLIGLSIAGALFHNLGQILVATFVLGNLAVFYYLPILTLLALPTGFMVGIIAKYFLKYLKKARQ